MTNNDKNIDVMKQAAEYILAGKTDEAGEVIRKGYPFTPINKDSRNYTKTEQMEQFFKDGFIDRYFGTKLINPGMLRLLSEKLPEEFPYQANWNTEVCHMAYWDYTPTIDHIDPISRGGKDDKSNWTTTSMKGNLAKSNYTMEQLNFHLYSPGDIHEWDGLSKLFIEIVDKNPELKQLSGIKDWYGPTKRIMEQHYTDLLPEKKTVKKDTAKRHLLPQKTNRRNIVNTGADKQAFLDNIKNHSDKLSDTAIYAMSDILAVFENISRKFNLSLVYSRSGNGHRVLATLKDNDNKSVFAEYSNGEIWATGQDNNKDDDIKIFIRSVLSRLIEEKLFKKTENSLSASQWGINLTGSKGNSSIDKQIIRFVEILNEEI